MSERSEFASRLREHIEAAGYESRPAVLEREFNSRYWGKSVSFQAVRRWLKGEAIPTQEKLQVLAEWLKVEPHVLRFGEHTTQVVRASRKRWEEGIDYLERETFEAFLALPANQRRSIREIILALASASSVKAEVSPRKGK